MATPSIKLHHLTKCFASQQAPWWRRRAATMRTVRALDDCSVQIEPGSICALFGLNGAGKTTLLKTLATLVEPTSGQALVYGHDVVREAHRVRQRIGWMTGEARSFYWRLSGKENLRFFAALHGLTSTDADARITEVTAPLGLSDILPRSVATYSSGQKQRLAIARALLGRPQVLLCDEPTQSLDAPTARVLRQLLRDEFSRRRGCTVLYTTHQLDDVRETADRVIVLDRGRIASLMTADAFMAGPSTGQLSMAAAP